MGRKEAGEAAVRRGGVWKGLPPPLRRADIKIKRHRLIASSKWRREGGGGREVCKRMREFRGRRRAWSGRWGWAWERRSHSGDWGAKGWLSTTTTPSLQGTGNTPTPRFQPASPPFSLPTARLLLPDPTGGGEGNESRLEGTRGGGKWPLSEAKEPPLCPRLFFSPPPKPGPLLKHPETTRQQQHAGCRAKESFGRVLSACQIQTRRFFIIIIIILQIVVQQQHVWI